MKLSHAKYAKFEAFRTLYEREPAYRGQACDLIYLREPFSEIRIEKEDWDSSIAYGISLEVQGAAGGHIKEEIIPQMLKLCKTLDHLVHARLHGVTLGVCKHNTVQTAIQLWETLQEAINPAVRDVDHW